MKKLICTALCILIICGFMSGCKNNITSDSDMEQFLKEPVVNETVFPIVKDKLELKAVRRSYNDVRPPASELWMWQEYEKMTNIKINWDEVPVSGEKERKATLMAANDLPDLFYQFNFTVDELINYGSQGTFLPLNDLIERYAPNLRKLFKDSPEVKKNFMSADGNIYALGYVVEDPMEVSRKYYINNKWLENLNLKKPETIDELTSVLKAFKEKDANGNGDLNDEVPIYFSGNNIHLLELSLMGSFGIGNTGMKSAGIWIDKGKDERVRFIPQTENYKKLLQLLNEWYESGLFHPESFSGVEYARWVADGASGKIGMFTHNTPAYIGGVSSDYTGINVFTGPDGHNVLSGVSPSVISNFGFMITSANKDPVASIKWVDYFYGEEGSKFGTLGKESETYTIDASGNPKYIGEIANYKGGVQLGAFQYVDNVYGGNYPYKELDIKTRYKVRNEDMEEALAIDEKDYLQYMPAEIWPVFPQTMEESAITGPIRTDINAYIKEMRVKFITGKANFDSDWDEFVKKLDDIGAVKYTEYMQKQYEVYFK